MKDKKSLNRLFSTIILLLSSVVFIYVIGACMYASDNPYDLRNMYPAIAGIVLTLAILCAAVIVIKMVKVTVPTLKDAGNKTLAKWALVMDIIALVGFVFILCAFITANFIRGGDTTMHGGILACGLFGAPFFFIGEIGASKLIKGALK